MEDRTRVLEKAVTEGKVNVETLNRLKRFGVFVKTYNMTHLLATRYKVSDSFGIDANMKKLDDQEAEVRDLQTKLNKSESGSNKDETTDLRKRLGEARDGVKRTVSDFKLSTGTELFNRFMRGFVRTKDNTAEENEKIENTQFLFNKLRF
jgi:hypothetical protein